MDRLEQCGMLHPSTHAYLLLECAGLSAQLWPLKKTHKMNVCDIQRLRHKNYVFSTMDCYRGQRFVMCIHM